jgi:hypothetical protein
MFTCGLKESTKKSVKLNDVSATIFKAILEYMYTGIMEVKDVPLASMVDYIAVAHLYQMKELAIDVARNLETDLNMENVLDRYKIAALLYTSWMSSSVLVWVSWMRMQLLSCKARPSFSFLRC